MERGKMSSGRGGKSKVPQHPQDIFALGTKSTLVASRDAEKRNIHKPSTSGVDRKRDASSFGAPTPGKRSRIGSPAESVGGTSLEVDPVDLVPNVLQALDTHNSDKLLGLLTGSIRLLKSQRSKPDPILCMGMLYLVKIRPNMFAHETVTQSLCGLLKREQGAAFKNKGNPLVFVLACNMLYAAHKDSKNWPDTFIKVYIEDALNERWWVDCTWCKCLVENIATAFNTTHPASHLIPTESTLGNMSPSGSGSPLMPNAEDDAESLNYSVSPRYSGNYESVEALVLEAIKDQIQRRAAPDAIGKGFLKLLSATCGFPEIRMIAASRLEGWLHSGKLWRAAQELLAYVCCNVEPAPRDHEVLAQLARMRLKTKPLANAYVACLREMVSDNAALLRSVVTHTIYNELSNVRSPNNMAVLAALVLAQPQHVPRAMADTYHELLYRPEDYLRPLRSLTRECFRNARADSLLPLARALASSKQQDPPPEIRERAFNSMVDLFSLCCLVIALGGSSSRSETRMLVGGVQGAALGWLRDHAPRHHHHDYRAALNKIMFVESAEAYSKADGWPGECERAALHRACADAPLHAHALQLLLAMGRAKEIPVSPGDVFELIETVVRRACALPPEDSPLQVEQLSVAEHLFQLCHYHPPDNMVLPQGYVPPQLYITLLYWRAWLVLVMLCAHNPTSLCAHAYSHYPTLRAIVEICITNKPSQEWVDPTPAELEAERAAILQLETHMATASHSKVPVTEHNARLLSQLSLVDPVGPARRPPPGVIESVMSAASSLRLGRLLCRQPALLLELTQQHGTRRAMPWLQRLLRHEKLPLRSDSEYSEEEVFVQPGTSQQLPSMPLLYTAPPPPPPPPPVLKKPSLSRKRKAGPTINQVDVAAYGIAPPPPPQPHQSASNSVLPVQCLCELVCAGVGGGSTPSTPPSSTSGSGSSGGGGGASVVLHVQRVVSESAVGARAVLLHYAARLAHAHPHTRNLAHKGLKLVVSTSTEDISDANMENIGPEDWIEQIWELEHWPAVKEEMAERIRAACLVECIPSHMAAYIAFLYRYTSSEPQADHSLLLMDVSQVLMERMTVMGSAVPRGGGGGAPHQHLTLHALLRLYYNYMQKVFAGEVEVMQGAVTLEWANGRQCALPPLLVHAQLKLLCHGATLLDVGNEVYNWLVSLWAGDDGPLALATGPLAATLAPDWLRLHLVRSAKPPLVRAGLRDLPAHKLALFIQTFGMPVASMTALLSALDACPAGAVSRVVVERPYMAQLLRVQRARGARGGDAFAANMQLRGDQPPPDEDIFSAPPLPAEPAGAWCSWQKPPAITPQAVRLYLDRIFGDHLNYDVQGDIAFTCMQSIIVEESKSLSQPITEAVVSYLIASLISSQHKMAHGILRRPTHSGPLLRNLTHHATGPQRKQLTEISDTLLKLYKGVQSPIVAILREIHTAASKPAGETRVEHDIPDIPKNATKQQLVAILESTPTSNLEKVGAAMISSQESRLLLEVITHLLETRLQPSHQIKSESGAAASSGGICGLLLDWMFALQPDVLPPEPTNQMRIMFGLGLSTRAAWRALPVTVLAHRASSLTLYPALAVLLADTSAWEPTAVLNFATTLSRSARVWQGRDRTGTQNSLTLTYKQIGSLVEYIILEAGAALAASNAEGMRRRLERRLPLLLGWCLDSGARVSAALRAADRPEPAARMLCLMLCMQVPKLRQLMEKCEERPKGITNDPASQCDLDAASSSSACDRVTHSLFTHVAHPDHHHNKARCIESGARNVCAVYGALSARALPLCAALLRGTQPPSHALLHALLALPHHELRRPELGEILEVYVRSLSAGGGGSGGGGGGGGAGGARDSWWAQRLAVLVRRARALRLTTPQLDNLIAASPIAGLVGGAGSGEEGSSWTSPPPVALRELLSSTAPPATLHQHLLDVESWCVRREGGGCGGGAAVCGAVAPYLTAPHAALRHAARQLLVKLTPALEDTQPVLQAILECLDSQQPEYILNLLENLPELVSGMQQHACQILMRVFELGMKTSYPVDAPLCKAISHINLQRGC